MWRIPREANVVEQERRLTPRYSFAASAELHEEQSTTNLTARVSELSLQGCYLDMVNPSPVRTIVLIKISSAKESFQAKGKVVYVHPGIGAGVIFVEVSPQSQAILQRWLARAEDEQQTLIG
jgi:PilZ domain